MDWKKFWTMTFALSCGIATTSLIGLNMLLTILYDTPVFNGERLVWTMPIYFSVEGYFEIPVFFLGTIVLFYILCKLVLKYREEKEGGFYESGRRNLW